MSDAWERGGGNLHDRLYADQRLDLRSGGGRLSLDVTSLLKYEKEDGEEIHGFLLAAHGREGNRVPAGDLARFSRLGEATLEVSYRKLPPSARRMRQEVAARREVGTVKGTALDR